MLNNSSSIDLKNLATKQSLSTISPPKIVKYNPMSVNDLAHKRNKIPESKSALGYNVVYESKNYQIIRNRPLHGEEDSLEIVKSNYRIPQKLPNVKMFLQSDRKPNMSNAHDARFDNINKEPSIYSKSKKTLS